MQQTEELKLLADRLISDGSSRYADILKKRNHVDTLCQRFMARVKRQTEVASRSVQYHQLVDNVRF